MTGLIPGLRESLSGQKSQRIKGAIGFIEDTFGITVEDSEMLPENLDSIERFANFVTRKKG